MPSPEAVRDGVMADKVVTLCPYTTEFMHNAPVTLYLCHEDEVMVAFTGACPACGHELTLLYSKENE